MSSPGVPAVAADSSRGNKFRMEVMLSLWLFAAACLARPSLPQSLVWPRHQFLPAVTRFGDVYERPIVLIVGWVRGRRLPTCLWLTHASLGGERRFVLSFRPQFSCCSLYSCAIYVHWGQLLLGGRPGRPVRTGNGGAPVRQATARTERSTSEARRLDGQV